MRKTEIPIKRIYGSLQPAKFNNGKVNEDVYFLKASKGGVVYFICMLIRYRQLNSVQKCLQMIIFYRLT